MQWKNYCFRQWTHRFCLNCHCNKFWYVVVSRTFAPTSSLCAFVFVFVLIRTATAVVGRFLFLWPLDCRWRSKDRRKPPQRLPLNVLHDQQCCCCGWENAVTYCQSIYFRHLFAPFPHKSKEINDNIDKTIFSAASDSWASDMASAF